MAEIFAPNLVFLNNLEPIPEDSEKYEISLLEKCIYGHLRHIYGNPVKIMISPQGARRLMDIVYALRLEVQNQPAFSIQEMKFPTKTFGINLPQTQTGEIVARSNGLCHLKISDISGRWKRTFWIDMRGIDRIGRNEPSYVVKDWKSIGNLEISVYMFKREGGSLSSSSYCNENMISVPILSLERLTPLATSIVPWHNVDPVQDGRFGVAGYLLQEDRHMAIYGALDIFVRDSEAFMSRKHSDGIVCIAKIADSEPESTFSEALIEAEKNAPDDMKHFIKRAIADLNISYRSVEIYDRVFHDSQFLTFGDAVSLLSSYDMSLVSNFGSYDILHNGQSMLSMDRFLSGEMSEQERELAYVARFADIMLHPLRSHPFLYRRNVLMNVPLQVLTPFIPEIFNKSPIGA